MEPSYARTLDPSIDDTTLEDFCTPTTPMLVRCDARLADRGAFRAQRDWQRIFGTGLPRGFAGIVGPEHNFVQATMPGMLPERIELVSYVVELTFIADDVIDEAESPAVVIGPMLADLLDGFQAGQRAWEAEDQESVLGSLASPAKRLWASVTTALFEMDRPRAEDVARWFQKLALALATQSGKEKQFENIEQYLEYRKINVASQYVSPLSFLFSFPFSF